MPVATVTAAKTAVEVREVTTKKELRLFVDYPNKLYRDVPAFVPAMYGDDLEDWDKEKNPAFSYCEARCWLAWREGRIVGRIGAILSHKANEKWGTNRMRFTQVDFIDDEAVSAALFATVEAWAAEKGCNQVHGPLGFTDQDREGMLIEGFDRRSMFITYYNHPYYNDHLSRLGYVKDVDWMEYKITVPTATSPQTEKLHRLAQRVLTQKKLHVADITHRRQYKTVVSQVFSLVNKAYAHLYGTVAITKEQEEKYTKKFAPIIDPDFTCFVMDEQNNLVAFGLSAPSMAAAMQRCHGHLFPLGWIHVLRALSKNDTIDMFLIAVEPALQGVGINAIVLDHVLQGALRRGIRYAETGPQLEENSKILTQWKMFEKEQHKRRRCYVKDIGR